MAEQVRNGLGVMGYVEREADFGATVDAAVEAGLVEERRMELIRGFTGSVVSHEIFKAVKAVDGVGSLEYDHPVYAAEE